LRSTANCSSSNFIRADTPSSPESSMRPPMLTWLDERSVQKLIGLAINKIRSFYIST
jgi:hypothetical protein